jgi:hypothetical protein
VLNGCLFLIAILAIKLQILILSARKMQLSVFACVLVHHIFFLQPLNVGVFGPLKRVYGKLVQGMMAAGNSHIDKEDFLHLINLHVRRSSIKMLYAAASQELDSSRLIKSGFMKRLLFNFVHHTTTSC